MHDTMSCVEVGLNRKWNNNYLISLPLIAFPEIQSSDSEQRLVLLEKMPLTQRQYLCFDDDHHSSQYPVSQCSPQYNYYSSESVYVYLPITDPQISGQPLLNG